MSRELPPSAEALEPIAAEINRDYDKIALMSMAASAKRLVDLFERFVEVTTAPAPKPLDVSKLLDPMAPVRLGPK